MSASVQPAVGIVGRHGAPARGGFAAAPEAVLADRAKAAAMRQAAKLRSGEEFTRDRIAGQYEQLLLMHVPKQAAASGAREERATA